jgi:K+-transporting ATPase A subunit
MGSAEMGVSWMDLTQLIGSLGFPIAITSYLIVVFRGTLDKNTEAVNNLSSIIQTLKDGKKGE